jgi:hypothetical protein
MRREAVLRGFFAAPRFVYKYRLLFDFQYIRLSAIYAYLWDVWAPSSMSRDEDGLADLGVLLPYREPGCVDCGWLAFCD